MIKTPLMLSALSLVAAVVTLAPTQAHAAATHTVCSSGCDYTTPQAAVAAAASGDTIQLGDETYSGVIVIPGTMSLTLEATSGRPLIDAGGYNNAVRVTPNSTLTLRGVTVTGGQGNSGIKNAGTLTLDDVYVLGNDTVYGGIWNLGTLTIVGNSVVAGNSTTSLMAGGISNFGGDVVISNATFLANQGYLGGAIGNYGGDVSVFASSFTANAGYLGGGIHNSFGDLEVEASSFSTNNAQSYGGAWSNHNIGGTATMIGVGYAANSSDTGNYDDCYDVNGGCAQ